MKRAISLFATMALIAIGAASAQYDETNNLLYFARRTPQSNQLNPAFFPEKNVFYLSLPGMGIQMGFPLALGDIVRYDPESEENVININQLFDKLNDNSTFRFGLDANIVGFGLKAGNVFVDFNTQLRGNMNLGLPISVLNTVMNGNVNGDGSAVPEMLLLDGNLLNGQLYLETSVGAGMRLPVIPLTVGVHAKLLSGVMNLQMDNTRATFETEEDFETVRARMYYEIMAASALPIDTTGGMGKVIENMINSVSTNPLEAFKSLYYLNSGNTGVAFDIGAKYELGPFTFSASVNDLTAGIHWKQNVVAMVPTEGEGALEFDGVDVTNFINQGGLYLDTLGSYFSQQLEGMAAKWEIDEGTYWYNIPTKINLAATMKLTNMFHAGILFHGQFDRGLFCKNTVYQREHLAENIQFDWNDNVVNTFRFNTTVSVGVNLFDWLEVIAGSSMVYDGSPVSLGNFFNPGLGAILSLGTTAQAYAMVDYVSSLYLAEMKAFNAKAGINILIGKGKRKH